MSSAILQEKQKEDPSHGSVSPRNSKKNKKKRPSPPSQVAHEAAIVPSLCPASDAKTPTPRRNQINKQDSSSIDRCNHLLKKKVSHSLSWALRHAAPQLKLTMTADGFVPLDELLQHSHSKLKCINDKSVVEAVVAENDKQRFSLQLRPTADYYPTTSAYIPSSSFSSLSHDYPSSAMIWCIRANQGHSITGIIDPDQLLTRLTPRELVGADTIPTTHNSSEEHQKPPTATTTTTTTRIVHGTTSEAWEQIRTEGVLHRMTRTHIHFATGLPGDNDIVSGMRRNSAVHVYLNMEQCVRAGVVFYKSANGVILTAGVNEEGWLPIKYFSHVVDATTGRLLLDQRGGVASSPTIEQGD
jgi:2'-phosphotransferase